MSPAKSGANHVAALAQASAEQAPSRTARWPMRESSMPAKRGVTARQSMKTPTVMAVWLLSVPNSALMLLNMGWGAYIRQ